MFDAIMDFIQNPTADKAATLVLVILTTVIVALIAYHMSVWQGRRWYRNSRLDIGCMVRWGTATGSVIARVTNDTKSELRLQTLDYLDPVLGTWCSDAILVPFQKAPNMVWKIIEVSEKQANIEGLKSTKNLSKDVVLDTTRL